MELQILSVKFTGYISDAASFNEIDSESKEGVGYGRKFCGVSESIHRRCLTFEHPEKKRRFRQKRIHTIKNIGGGGIEKKKSSHIEEILN